tara:strand:+ start:712 stop:1737 length:1026 start_codon:yes stop_codon:yes gene_type:complete
MRVNILGAGTWGTALAFALSKNDIDVTVWGRNDSKIRKLDSSRIHSKLKNFTVPNNIKFTTVFPDLNNGICILATPTTFLNDFIKLAKSKRINKLIIGCKGLYATDNNDFLMPSQALLNNVSSLKYDKICILTGPSHAEELVKENATAVLAASTNIQLSKNIQSLFSSEFLRVYTLDENDNILNQVKASEIGGAVKNVISIASGICDGLRLGDNTKAALIARGMSEIIDFYKSICKCENPPLDTLYGLSGLGDLVGTAYSKYSRNRKFGQFIGEGISINDSLLKTGMVVEGYKTSFAIKYLSDKFNINMPICYEIYQILYNHKSPRKSLKHLMDRKLTNEN